MLNISDILYNFRYHDKIINTHNINHYRKTHIATKLIIVALILYRQKSNYMCVSVIFCATFFFYFFESVHIKKGKKCNQKKWEKIKSYARAVTAYCQVCLYKNMDPLILSLICIKSLWNMLQLVNLHKEPVSL